MSEPNNEFRGAMEVIAMAAASPESPMCEFSQNQYLLKDLSDLLQEKRLPEVFVFSGGNNVDAAVAFSIPKGTWTPAPDLPENRAGHKMALIFGGQKYHMFAVGGSTCDHVSKDVLSLTVPTKLGEVEMATMKTAEWKKMPDMKECRMYPGVGVVDGKIYVIGGWGGGPYLNTVEVFLVKEGKWIHSDDHLSDRVPRSTMTVPPPPMTTERGSMGVAVVGKRIFVIGGHNGTGYLSMVEVLDTQTNKWSAIPSMITARYRMGIAVVDDRFIWILGGGTFGVPTDLIEIFDVEEDEWIESPAKMPSPMLINSAFVICRKIFVVSEDRQIAVLDLDRMEWAKIAPAEQPPFSHGFGVVAF